jgi:hypothetical protein
MSALVDLSSQVRAVTVYRRGAMVTRAAELVRDGDGFPARLQLVGLPLSLDDSSMRVELEGVQAGGVLPIIGDLRVTLAVPGQNPQWAPPTNEELEQAKLELALISGELEQLVRAEGRLSRLQPIGRGRPEEGKAPGPSPTSARLELLGFRRERAEQLADKIRAQRERERVAKEWLATLRERERIASTQRNTRTYELRKAAVLELDGCKSPGLAERVRIKLHYFVPGARWAPAYTVRLDRSMRAGSLELHAMVGQATGEDWRGVDLTLSTAIPQQWTELPKLESQRIGRRQAPPAKTGWRPPPVGAGQLYADFDRGLGQPLAAAPAPEPELDLLEEEPEDDFELDRLLNQGRAEEQARQSYPPPPPSMPPMAAPSYAPGPPMPGAPPPKPVAAAPAYYPEREMMAQSAPKRGGGLVGALVGGAVGAVGGAVGAVASAFSDRDEGGGYADQTGSYGMPPPEPEQEELLAGRELLDYGRLRMHAPADSRRGSLRRIETRLLYQQLSVESFAIDLAIQQIEGAVATARVLEQSSVPEGHHWPQSEGGFDYAYVADAPCELASDGRFHALAIDRREAEATPRYITVPRETQDVFRIVALRNPLAAPLLPGPADVYVAGKFALTTPVKITPIGGRIELGLGVEQAIKIARNITFNEDSSGMFKRQLELHHVIGIEIANHLGSSATVEVRERIPVSGTDEVEVTVERVDPQWEDYEPTEVALDGGRRWIVEVPANGKCELEAHWVAKLPTNHELIGGNRREV